MKKPIRPTVAVMVVVAMLMRLVPHPPNFTPVGATALFSGAYLKTPLGYIIAPLTLFVTDLVLGFHATMPYVYGSFLLTTALGQLLSRGKVGLARVATLGAISSVIFFLITNFGVWAETGLYPKTAGGLIASYIAGLPFLANMIAADVLFATGYFALYQGRFARTLAKVDQTLLRYLVANGK